MLNFYKTQKFTSTFKGFRFKHNNVITRLGKIGMNREFGIIANNECVWAIFQLEDGVKSRNIMNKEPYLKLGSKEKS